MSPGSKPRPPTSGLRTILPLVRNERRNYAIGSIFVVIGIITALAYPYAIKLTIDEGVMRGDAHRINVLAAIMLGLLLSEGVATCLRDYWFNVAAERIAATLRKRTLAHLLAQEIAFFDSRNTGELTTRLAADIPPLQRVLGEEFADASRFALWGIGGTILLFYTSPLLALIVLLGAPPMIAAAALLGRRVRRVSAQMTQAYAEAGAYAEETIAGIRTVRAFSQEADEVARFDGKLQHAVGLAKDKIMTTAIAGALSFLVAESAALLALWLGGNLIAIGRFTSGGLISFILYAFIVARGFRNASTFWTDALRAIGGAQWVFDLLARAPRLAPNGGRRLAQIDGTVVLEGLRFNSPTRPDAPALADFDCTIAPGEVVAFVGHSGAGKSTILNLLLRFYDPDEGRILVDGHDLRHIDAAWLRTQIGSVMQEPVLFSRSVGDNIRYGRPDAGQELVAEAADVACARGFIEQLPRGYETEIGDRGVQLSGGQRQRLAIARAVVRRPRILILDEATSALDAENESLVLRALRSLDYKPTTLIVAHRLSTVVNVDRVAVLDRGRLIALGPHDELLQTCEFYRQLVETQLVAR